MTLNYPSLNGDKQFSKTSKDSSTKDVYIIGSSTGEGKVSFSSTPKKHYTLDSALKESRRIAKNSTEKMTQRIIVFKVVDVVEVHAKDQFDF